MDSVPGRAATALRAAVSETVAAAFHDATPQYSSVIAKAGQLTEARSSSSWLSLFGKLVFAAVHLVSTVLYYTVKLTTISIPSLLFTMFSASLTVTMNATTLMLILAAIISAVSWVVRYRYLNKYSRLPPEPQRKEPDIDLFPDTHEGGVKSGLSSYLDEFLSAIKIFGYLERPVFHELTRSMQTRKLIAGETLNLEEEQGFCLVVDGLVEIFVKSSQATRKAASHARSSEAVVESTSEEEEIKMPGQQSYQLLTEVRNGAPMSSLFSIMSLFTEDIRLRHSDEEYATDPSVRLAANNHTRQPLSADFGRQQQNLTVSVPTTPHMSGTAGSGPGVGGDASAELSSGSRALHGIPPMSLDFSANSQRLPPRPLPRRRETKSVHPDIIARATVDTTIAIIPASAFRRLIKIYPKATAHIVHVILSRFQRVTLATAYNYLGLTGEVMQTEKSMIKYTTNQLPNFLRGDALDRLKEKFSRDREKIGEEEGAKGIALHNPQAGRPRRSTLTLRKGAVLHAVVARQQTAGPVITTTMAPEEGESTDSLSPGDLLVNVQTARTSLSRPISVAGWPGGQASADFDAPLAQRAFNPFATQRRARVSLEARDSLDEDNIFRESILECMFKSIGLSSGGTASRDPESMEGSPRLVSMDQRRQKAAFGNNAFGFLDSLDGVGDMDSESVTSSNLHAQPPANPHVLAHDMRDEAEIVFFRKGAVLVEQGERSPGLYYVIDGFLDVGVTGQQSSADILQSPSQSSLAAMDRRGSKDSAEAPRKKDNSRHSVALIKPGGLAGYIGTVSSYRSFIDVVAKTDVYVGFLPRASLERIVDRYPIVLLTMAKRLTNLLPRLILHIDFALEWLQVNASHVLFHEGDESEAIYLVLNGRLRLVSDRKDGGGMDVRAEFGQGESVGELEVLTESARPGTLHAIRDTELVKFPRTLFNSLAQEHPNITIKISKIIASRMRALIDEKEGGVSRGVITTSTASLSRTLNLRTVAVLPVTAGVPVVEFASTLQNALAQVGPPNSSTTLSHSAILNHLGRHAFNKMGKLKLAQYLADLEEKYGLVVYVADTNVNSPWTQTCITQADCILLVGLAEGSPEIGEYERFMLGMKSTARKVLVLLHAERYSKAGLTRAWLKNRMWITGGHFHMQMAFGARSMSIHTAKRTGTSLKQRVQILQAEIQKYTSRKARNGPFYAPDSPFKGDFHRLARRLCGKSVGLVLGGGGARGIAHIGIIRAMEEAGIPVDVVGGTSIGAFIGALYARHADVVPIYGLAKKFAGRMASMWRFALDLTYPSASYTTGHEFNRGIFKTFGTAQIEDFWLEFYCNTTNISRSRAEFHTSGYAWRYVRASMSLAGLLPPLCDEGAMLLDGGYVDNLTVSRMKALGADVIFAVDVGALDDDTPQTFGDSLSGLWAFWNRWNPLSAVPNPPTLAEIQARLAYVSSVDALERAKTMPGCIYLRPPIDDYGTLDFGRFDEIYALGYRYGKEFLARLKEAGVLPLGGEEETEAKKALRRTMAPRRASI